MLVKEPASHEKQKRMQGAMEGELDVVDGVSTDVLARIDLRTLAIAASAAEARWDVSALTGHIREVYSLALCLNALSCTFYTDDARDLFHQ